MKKIVKKDAISNFEFIEIKVWKNRSCLKIKKIYMFQFSTVRSILKIQFHIFKYIEDLIVEDFGIFYRGN